MRKLITRHESLRTGFEMMKGEVVQRIYPQVDFAIEHHQADTEDSDQIEQIVRNFFQSVLISANPRCCAPGSSSWSRTCVLSFSICTISCPTVYRWQIVMEEFSSFYAGEQLPPLRIHYKDYAVWQQSKAHRERIGRQEAYWLQTFEGELPTADLPMDYERSAVRSYEGAHVEGATSKLLSLRSYANWLPSVKAHCSWCCLRPILCCCPSTAA